LFMFLKLQSLCDYPKYSPKLDFTYTCPPSHFEILIFFILASFNLHIYILFLNNPLCAVVRNINTMRIRVPDLSGTVKIWKPDAQNMETLNNWTYCMYLCPGIKCSWFWMSSCSCCFQLSNSIWKLVWFSNGDLKTRPVFRCSKKIVQFSDDFGSHLDFGPFDTGLVL
jgi:hypothetical protein